MVPSKVKNFLTKATPREGQGGQSNTTRGGQRSQDYLTAPKNYPLPYTGNDTMELDIMFPVKQFGNNGFTERNESANRVLQSGKKEAEK